MMGLLEDLEEVIDHYERICDRAGWIFRISPELQARLDDLRYRQPTRRWPPGEKPSKKMAAGYADLFKPSFPEPEPPQARYPKPLPMARAPTSYDGDANLCDAATKTQLADTDSSGFYVANFRKDDSVA